jgi:hypothetical protein
MAPVITNQDDRPKNGEQEHTLSHGAAQANTRILELESRCAVIRTVLVALTCEERALF